MMRTLRRLLGIPTAADADRDRHEREQQVRDGLHEAAARVHYLEVQAAVRARRHPQAHTNAETDRREPD
jgi:hypothetical protein